MFTRSKSRAKGSNGTRTKGSNGPNGSNKRRRTHKNNQVLSPNISAEEEEEEEDEEDEYEYEEEEEDINFGIINPNARLNVGVNLGRLDLAGPNETEYTGPTKSANALTKHDFRRNPHRNRVLGYGISKTVWSNGSRAVVNAKRTQRHVRDKAKEEYNFTKILHAKFDFFPNVAQIPHLIGKNFNKFVYFSEMAQKVPLTTRAEGELYLREASKMFERLYETKDEYFMLLLDIKPENFGIVDRGLGPTLIWLDVDTQCIMAVRKKPEKKDFYIKYQQLLLLLTFLKTSCPRKEELCTSVAEEFHITKYDLQSFLNYEFEQTEQKESKEEKEQKEREKERKRIEDTELAGYHQRFLLSCGLNRSANHTAGALLHGYFISPPYHLRFYIGDKYNYEYFKNLLPDVSIAENYVPKV